jgi:hypothetical protein
VASTEELGGNDLVILFFEHDGGFWVEEVERRRVYYLAWTRW